MRGLVDEDCGRSNLGGKCVTFAVTRSGCTEDEKRLAKMAEIPVQIVLRPYASSLPLASFAFGVGNVLYSAFLLHWIPVGRGARGGVDAARFCGSAGAGAEPDGVSGPRHGRSYSVCDFWRGLGD